MHWNVFKILHCFKKRYMFKMCVSKRVALKPDVSYGWGVGVRPWLVGLSSTEWEWLELLPQLASWWASSFACRHPVPEAGEQYMCEMLPSLAGIPLLRVPQIINGDTKRLAFCLLLTWQEVSGRESEGHGITCQLASFSNSQANRAELSLIEPNSLFGFLG